MIKINKNSKIISILLLLLFLIGCNQTSNEQKDEKLNIIVSILPQKAFVNAIAGDLVNVKELIPPGGSPATYEPKPSDLKTIEKANIYFRIGYLPFEKSHTNKFAELNPKMKIIDTSTNVKLRYFGEHEEHTHDHEEYEEYEGYENQEKKYEHKKTDPHIWLSPIQVKKQVDTITQTLIQEDKTNAETYKQNAEKFKAQLDKLHTEIKTEFKELKTNKLMVFHPAWGYFADEYGLKQIAIEQSGKEPTAQELQQLIKQAKEQEIKVIFIQTQFNKKIAESIAKEINAIIIPIDPLSEDYINNLKKVATIIAENLKNNENNI